MFSALVKALQEGQLGDAEGPEKENDGEEVAGEFLDGSSGKTTEGTDPAAGFSLLNLANTWASTVQQKASEIVATVKETDWKTEIEQFKKELQEDTQQLAHTIEDAVEHLPDNVRLPDQASSKDLQVSLTVWQEQLNSFGKSLYVGTSELIGQVQDAIQEELHQQSQATGRKPRAVSANANRYQGVNAKYSRFEAEVSAMQRDSSTYCDEPEDLEEFEQWLQTFDLEQKKVDIDEIIKDNAFMSELQARIVPLIVEYDVFWTRYFYRLHKLQQKHEQRVQLAQRATNVQEEEIGWDDDVSEQGTQSPRTSLQPAHLRSDSVDSDAVKATSAEEEDTVGASASIEPDSQLADVQDKSDAAVIETVPEAAPEASSKPDDDGTSSDSAIVKVNPQMSDEEGLETATASESGSSGDPWCVVTSPSKKQAEAAAARSALDEHEVTSPSAVPEKSAAPVADKKGTKEHATFSKDMKIAGGVVAAVATIAEEPAVEATSLLTTSITAAEENPEAPAPAKQERVDLDDEDIDLDELSGDDGAPEGNEEVDEDWGSWE